MIKDSGNRTTFASGAVRDMHKGKGRFDLLPWHAIHEVAIHCEDGAEKYGERNVDKGIPQHSLIDSAFRHLKRYVCGETDEPHLRAAAWNILFALEQETTHPELLDIPYAPQSEPEDEPDEPEAGASSLEWYIMNDMDEPLCFYCTHCTEDIELTCVRCSRINDSHCKSLFEPNWTAIKNGLNAKKSRN